MEFLRSVMWVAAGRWAHSLLSLLSFAIIVARISPEAYGAYALASTVLILAEVFGTDVTEQAIVRHNGTETAALGSGLLVACLGAALIGAPTLLMGLLIARWQSDGLTGQLLIALSGVVLLQAAASLARGRMLRAGHMRSFALALGVGNLFGASVGIVGVMHGLGIWGLVLQQATLNFAIAVMGKAGLSFRLGNCPSDERTEQVRFALYGLASSALNITSNRIDVVLAAIFFGQAGAGAYGLAKRLVQILQDLLSSAFDKALVSFLNRNRGRVGKAASAALLGQAILTFPAFAGFALPAPSLVPAIFGSDWAEAALIVPAMALGGIFRAAVALERAQQVFDGQIRRIALVRLGELLLGFALLWPIAPLGLVWLGAGFSLRYAISYLLVVRSATSPMEFRKRLATSAESLACPFVATLVMAGAVVLVSLVLPLSTLATAVVQTTLGAAVYLTLIWRMRRNWWPQFASLAR